MKRCICLLCAFLVAVTAFCGCIERPASGVSSGGAATAMPDTDSSGLAAPVPCPAHDQTMEVENRNAEQPALLIAPDGEDNLWIWTPSKTDETLGTLISTPAAPAVVRWSEQDTAQTEPPLWYAQTALYQSGERIILCCAALESERQVVLFESTDGGANWSEQRFDLAFSAAGAPCFLSAFGESGLSAFVSSAQPGHSICGFVQSAPGSEWLALAASVSPAGDEQGACFTWAGMITEELGFVCCGYKLAPQPNVYMTSDGGDSWFKLSLPLPDGFDETTGYLVGCGAALDGDALLLQARWIVQEEERTVTYRSTDQGRSWQLTAVGKPGPRSS